MTGLLRATVARIDAVALRRRKQAKNPNDKKYPLVLHTDAGRTFSTVRRMNAEKEMGIPIFLRTGFDISTENGKAANAMTEDEWERFYNALSERLERDYPSLYKRIFSGG